MPLFSESDKAWLEDVCWDLEEIVNEACDFVQYVAVIGDMAKREWNVTVSERKLSYPSFSLRPAVLHGSGDIRAWGVSAISL